MRKCVWVMWNEKKEEDVGEGEVRMMKEEKGMMKWVEMKDYCRIWKPVDSLWVRNTKGYQWKVTGKKKKSE